MSIRVSGAGDGSADGVCSPPPLGPEPGPPAIPGTGLPQLDMAVLDPAVLDRLEEELGNSAVTRAFAEDYISIWGKRINYLMRSVADNAADAAMDAVLSIKNSACMVGGSRLARLAAELEGVIRSGDLAAAQPLVAGIADAGRATVLALRQGYLARAA